MKRLAIPAFLIAAALPAAADQVVLAGGGSIEGIARDEGDRVVVEVPHGTITFPRWQVVSIVPGRTILYEYREQLASLEGSRDPEALFQTAEWARAHGITRHVDSLLQRVIAADPNHREARRLLGYVEEDGQWKTQAEILAARGMVFEDGRWTSVQERDRLRARERDQLAYRRERRAARTRALDQAEAYPYPLGLPAYTWPSRSRNVGSYNQSSLNYDPYSGQIRYTVPLAPSGMGAYR